jgi:hypothetical protein
MEQASDSSPEAQRSTGQAASKVRRKESAASQHTEELSLSLLFLIPRASLIRLGRSRGQCEEHTRTEDGREIIYILRPKSKKKNWGKANQQELADD